MRFPSRTSEPARALLRHQPGTSLVTQNLSNYLSPDLLFDTAHSKPQKTEPPALAEGPIHPSRVPERENMLSHADTPGCSRVGGLAARTGRSFLESDLKAQAD